MTRKNRQVYRMPSRLAVSQPVQGSPLILPFLEDAECVPAAMQQFWTLAGISKEDQQTSWQAMSSIEKKRAVAGSESVSAVPVNRRQVK